MLIKKEGIINGIIYDHTAYHNSEYRFYPSIADLEGILKEIIESNSTTEYIRITPFYINSKRGQIEFEEYIFYIACRDKYDSMQYEEYIAVNMDLKVEDMSVEQKRMGEILYPLYDKNDVLAFQEAVKKYSEFLDELIPKMMEYVREKYDLRDDEIGFGYFCFEIHSA